MTQSKNLLLTFVLGACFGAVALLLYYINEDVVCLEPPSPETATCPQTVPLDPEKWCALCPLPEPVQTTDTCPDPASKHLRFDLEYCELARGVAEEGWHKASAHWGQCCDQCVGKEDPVTGEPLACDGC